ncbi:hypothetical protein KXD40_009236 [Peronospora effusa]|uniref:Uncharacterized protein n=1 Tax=Peronospora effusa TaxID=542832 RepID=A0A3M6VWU2_9STRA|nr:hypothetical protein DD238_000967 [Peronospora effusa]RQM09506.1 hypothetical protein DD237_007713 [Peronospora effusa]UIZ28717.1 hypothetical protein KXD40_009236 [Peronospora effusa]
MFLRYFSKCAFNSSFVKPSPMFSRLAISSLNFFLISSSCSLRASPVFSIVAKWVTTCSISTSSPCCNACSMVVIILVEGIELPLRRLKQIEDKVVPIRTRHVCRRMIRVVWTGKKFLDWNNLCKKKIEVHEPIRCILFRLEKGRGYR